MNVHLLDVNVLVALAWPNHVHHRRALAWFKKHQEAGWATCPLTQSGFVRVSSHRRAIPEARSPREAIHLLVRIVSLPHHRFWEDDVSLARTEEVPRERIAGHRQVTDAHLLALALRRKGRVATFDRGFLELVSAELDPEAVVTLIP